MDGWTFIRGIWTDFETLCFSYSSSGLVFQFGSICSGLIYSSLFVLGTFFLSTRLETIIFIGEYPLVLCTGLYSLHVKGVSIYTQMYVRSIFKGLLDLLVPVKSHLASPDIQSMRFILVGVSSSL